jgi:hypothetical protein
MSRERLVRRIEIEARAFANAPRGKDHLQLDRALGLIEAGDVKGHWRKKDADAAANLTARGGAVRSSAHPAALPRHGT